MHKTAGCFADFLQVQCNNSWSYNNNSDHKSCKWDIPKQGKFDRSYTVFSHTHTVSVKITQHSYTCKLQQLQRKGGNTKCECMIHRTSLDEVHHLKTVLSRCLQLINVRNIPSEQNQKAEKRRVKGIYKYAPHKSTEVPRAKSSHIAVFQRRKHRRWLWKKRWFWKNFLSHFCVCISQLKTHINHLTSIGCCSHNSNSNPLTAQWISGIKRIYKISWTAIFTSKVDSCEHLLNNQKLCNTKKDALIVVCGCWMSVKPLSLQRWKWEARVLHRSKSLLYKVNVWCY